MTINDIIKAGKATEDYNDGYYHLGKDIEDYPEAWLIVDWSLRGPGKTYSALWYMARNKLSFIYMKRTNIDVEVICSDPDYNPFKPLNRDKGTGIIPVLTREGMAKFYETDEDGKPIGAPVGHVLSFAKAALIKGFDLSEVDYIIMDEFIPLPGQVVKRKEADNLLSIYMTVRRDRVKRGRKDLRLILLANGSEISTPITNGLNLVDDMAEMNFTKTLKYYNESRGILYHHVTPAEFPKATVEKDAGILKAMAGTKWAATELEGEFGYNDFSNVVKMSIKGMKPLIHLHYNNTADAYIYFRERDGMYYMTDSRTDKFITEYDLDLENDQKRFWLEEGLDLRLTCIDGRMKFKKYSMYDLIINYKKLFTI